MNNITETTAPARVQIDQMIQLTSQAVTQVFQSMVGMELKAEAVTTPPEDPLGQIIGSVGFIGEATGVIYLYSGVGFARAITARMLGIPEPEVDDKEMLNDAVGELTNMVAGFVKSHLCDGGWDCTLTIPSIVRGQQMRVEGMAEVTRKVAGFGDAQYHLLTEILLKNPQD